MIDINKIEKELNEQFNLISEIEYHNQRKILDAFKNNKIASRHFYPSTGYGYSDDARDKLDSVFADVFGCESAFVRPHFCSATHAITLALRALLKHGDTMLSVSGRPYDTIATAIGISDETNNTLIDRGVSYKEISLNDEYNFDTKKILQTITNEKIKLILIQKSRGYQWRNTLSNEKIGELIKEVRKISKDIIVFVDNCYGEFTEKTEPTDYGADIAVGSLIKNAGGGLAPTGGYIAGKKIYVDIIKNFFTSPGTGGEIGSYEGNYRMFYQGLFMAPHTVAEALKGTVLFSAAYEKLGYDVMPKSIDARYDITQSIKMNDSREVIDFCKAIQKVSPVDAHVVPEPWDMPGYSDKVIMAAGTFIQGASIELSADAPIREPYIVYMQGGLTYQHLKIALIETLRNIGIDA